MDDNSDARVSHDALADDPRRRVDGSRVDDQPPAVRAVFVERPLRGVFGAGDTITVKLAMSEGLTVTGAPRFALRIGAQTRFATFQESLGTSTMLFDYVVDESDRDDNGFSIAADAVDLNGATIRDNAGNDANLDLGYFAFSDDPDYKVDGRLTPVPALPLGRGTCAPVRLARRRVAALDPATEVAAPAWAEVNRPAAWFSSSSTRPTPQP